MKDNLNKNPIPENMYDFEMDKVIEAVTSNEAKSVLLQFPDGLKHRAREVVDEIEEKTNAECVIWLGNCFGGCDIPITLRHKIDLVIQFGHNKFIKNPDGWDGGK
jgi:diphthamide biosynthesis enzyme Dph1/Dph2-like protein